MSTESGHNGSENSIVQKIAACLALANDPGATPAEAEAAAVMASKLMLKYSISEAKIQMAKGREKDLPGYTHEQIILGRFAAWEKDLIGYVAYANLCRLVTLRNQNGWYVFDIVGHEKNVAATIQMHRWLVSTLHRMGQEAYKREKPSNDLAGAGYRRPVHMDPMRFHVAFKHGATASVGNRIWAERRQTTKEQTTEDQHALMVITDNVTEALYRFYPHFRPIQYTEEQKAEMAERRRQYEEEAAKRPPPKMRKMRMRKQKGKYDDMAGEAFSMGREAGQTVSVRPHSEITA